MAGTNDVMALLEGSAITLKIWRMLNMCLNFLSVGKFLGQTAKLMVGVPDYDTYVQHMKNVHPDQTPMSYNDFFRERQEARYGGKGGFKCC